MWSGKLGVRSDAAAGQPARSMSGLFELSGDASRGQLVLSTPLGTTAARARWDKPAGPMAEPTEIELEADGRTLRFDTLGEMMQRAIGSQLPLPAMFDWLAGRPWPGARAERDASGQSFDQLGWRVDESRFADGLVVADRPFPSPALHVRVKLDAPADATPAPAAASAAAP